MFVRELTATLFWISNMIISMREIIDVLIINKVEYDLPSATQFLLSQMILQKKNYINRRRLRNNQEVTIT